MKLWRLVREEHVACDGMGALLHGTRYSPPGHPVVSFASEAGLAVLVVLRYLPQAPAAATDGFVLGWTETDIRPERAPDSDDTMIARLFMDWLNSGRSLLFAVHSRVLPEADVIYMNPLHAQARTVAPLITRPFDFAASLHRPPRGHGGPECQALR